jgi:hypothetical protein
MKQFRNLLVSALLMVTFAFGLSGCYETHYYHDYHHHSRVWYDHRHREPPGGVNFEIDVYHRHHRHH